VHVHFDAAVVSPASPPPEYRGNNALRVESNEQPRTLTLTIPQTADLLGISRSKAYEAARVGQIPTIRVDTRILVSRRGLEQMIDGQLH